MERKITEQFQIPEEVIEVKPFGDGLINSSYVVNTDSKKRYVLQRINTELFKDVDGLMNNIVLVTEFLKGKIRARGGDENRETLSVVRTKDNQAYYLDENNQAWRIYPFIEETVSFSTTETEEQFYKTGLAFGKFQETLDDFDASQLVEVIEKFHDTRHRYQQFLDAIENDPVDRVKNVVEEIEFVKSRKADAYRLYDMLDAGELPLRVTHNDTKLNNILMDEETLEGICIVDLDTIMPGLLLFDFGDSIRSGANHVSEDEKDLSKVQFDLDLFKAYTRGFLEGSKSILTQAELENLAWGARVITLEQGIRFLTDYINGDTYYPVTHETHNLERAKVQMKLVQEMEEQWDEMVSAVNEIAGK